MARSWWVVTPTIVLGRSDGYHAQGVAVAVSNKLTSMTIEVIRANECIMRQRIHHSLGVVSLVSVYAPTEASYLTVNDAFYAIARVCG